jgi:hypothetical protein
MVTLTSICHIVLLKLYYKFLPGVCYVNHTKNGTMLKHYQVNMDPFSNVSLKSLFGCLCY